MHEHQVFSMLSVTRCYRLEKSKLAGKDRRHMELSLSVMHKSQGLVRQSLNFFLKTLVYIYLHFYLKTCEDILLFCVSKGSVKFT